MCASNYLHLNAYTSKQRRMLTVEFGNDAFNRRLVSHSRALRICFQELSSTALFFKSCLYSLLLEADRAPRRQKVLPGPAFQLGGPCVDGLCHLLSVTTASSEQKTVAYTKPMFSDFPQFKMFLDQTTLGLWTSVIKSSEKYFKKYFNL